MSDPRFGITGLSEPSVCAVTGQPVRGRHANTFSLTGGGVYYVLAKALDQWSADLHQRLQVDFSALVAPPQDSPVDPSPKKGSK